VVNGYRRRNGGKEKKRKNEIDDVALAVG